MVKVSKTVSELEDLLQDDDQLVPITYILSIIAENYPKLISDRLIEKAKPFIKSENEKLRINTISIIGFLILNSPNLIEQYFDLFVQLLIDKSLDVRNNIHFFLHEFLMLEYNWFENYTDLILKALKLENKKENILSLLKYLNYSKTLNFEQLIDFRITSKIIISNNVFDNFLSIKENLYMLIKKFYPSLGEIDDLRIEEVE
ncbi:MAG: hypothetical protein ACFFAO_17115, partial [Candidatus Hermodarchaeota archaeon]